MAISDCFCRSLSSSSYENSNADNEDCVLLSVDDTFATITLNRPKVHNAMSEKVIARLQEDIGKVAELVSGESTYSQTNIRCLFLKSTGKNFSAGADLDYMKGAGSFSYDKNLEDAMKLSTMFDSLGKSCLLLRVSFPCSI